MEHSGHFWICFWLMLLSMSSCQDENTKKLVGAINQNTAAVQALRATDAKPQP